MLLARAHSPILEQGRIYIFSRVVAIFPTTGVTNFLKHSTSLDIDLRIVNGRRLIDVSRECSIQTVSKGYSGKIIANVSQWKDYARERNDFIVTWKRWIVLKYIFNNFADIPREIRDYVISDFHISGHVLDENLFFQILFFPLIFSFLFYSIPFGHTHDFSIIISFRDFRVIVVRFACRLSEWQRSRRICVVLF